MKKSPYNKLSLSLLLSFAIMYGVMFLNVEASDHIYFSLTRSYMALLMIAPMAILMVTVMGNMYTDKKKNGWIIITGLLVFAVALTGLRTQTPIRDIQYMKAMIPHHSSAILTSKQADIRDPEVRKLADGIIASQEREIAEMKALLKKLEK